MTLSDLSIRRPVFAWMLMSALMFFGVICFFHLGVSQFARGDATRPHHQRQLVGASPEVMETELVNPIEQAVISVEGIQDIESNMRQGTANIKLTFYTQKDIDAALQETNSKLRAVKLPDDVLPPTIQKINTDDNPIMWLAITSTKRSFKDVLTYVDLNLRDRLRVIPGVGNIVLGGWADRNLRVWVDNNKLLARQLTILDIRNTLKEENNESTSGYLENGTSEANVRTMGEAISPEQMGNLLITQRGGTRIYHSDIHLRAVATIEDGLADTRSMARSDGMVTLGVGIQKQHGENDVKVGEAVRAFVDQVNKELAVTDPDLHMYVNFDATIFTSQAIAETELTVLLSVIVTGLVCWAFLGSWTSTFNVLLSIPTSALGTFIVMDLLGFTINFFTLLGMSLAIGIVVDDAIMVLENIVRHFSHGQDRASGLARWRAGNHLRRHRRDHLRYRRFHPGASGQWHDRCLSLSIRHDHLHRRRPLSPGGDHVDAHALLAVHDREGRRVALRHLREQTSLANLALKYSRALAFSLGPSLENCRRRPGTFRPFALLN